MKRARTTLAVLVAGALLRCATIASEAGDIDAIRPNAQAGPFRDLRDSELHATTAVPAPYVLRSDKRNFRDPGAVALDDAAPGSIALYVVADDASGASGASGIYRYTAPDGRSFAADPDAAVLVAGQAWEGSAISGPDPHRVGNEIWVYYSGDGGIGLARSSDGVTFSRETAPVLSTASAAAWEGGKAPSAPAMLRVASSDFRLFYEANDRIGEARSSDGVHFERIGSEPLLAPSGSNGDDPPFDSEGVGAPHALITRSEEGRTITRLYYAGRGSDGRHAIGLASRFGTSGALERAVAPVYPNTKDARTPSVVAYPHFSVMYLAEQEGSTGTLVDHPAIAMGIAPGDVSIPLP